MLNYSEQGRALALLHGTEYQPNARPRNYTNKNYQSYLPYIAFNILVVFLFYHAALIPLIIILIILASIKSRELIRIKKQAFDFERDFATFLVSLAASLRCGNEPLSALFNSREMFPEESAVYKVITTAKDEANQGKNEDQVISSFAADIRHPELELFRAAFLLARSEGASLSTCLERLARVIRTRQSIRRKIKAAVAMQKLSAYGICAAVFGLLVFQILTAREQLMQSWQHPWGVKMLMLGGLLILTGFVWMLSLTRSKL